MGQSIKGVWCGYNCVYVRYNGCEVSILLHNINTLLIALTSIYPFYSDCLYQMLMPGGDGVIDDIF